MLATIKNKINNETMVFHLLARHMRRARREFWRKLEYVGSTWSKASFLFFRAEILKLISAIERKPETSTEPKTRPEGDPMKIHFSILNDWRN